MSYYHYTSTRNAEEIKKGGILKKGGRNVILTTLEPKNFNRDQILRKIYGGNYDKGQVGNMADWVVVVDSSKLDSNKLRKLSDEIYEYSNDVAIGKDDVMDKPAWVPKSSGSTNANGNIRYYHYTSTRNAEEIQKGGRLNKGGRNVILTTLEPKNFNRDQILRKIYGGNYDKGQVGNMADWIVVVDSSKLDSNKLRKLSNEIYEYSEDVAIGKDDVMDKPAWAPQSSGSQGATNTNGNKVCYYHYTSTNNAQDIQRQGILKRGVILTTLQPKKYFRDQILNKIYGINYDRRQFGNMADWVVVVDPSKLKSNKLRKVRDDVYESLEEIHVRKGDVIDKPRCSSQSTGNSQWSANMDGNYLYHYTDQRGANAIKQDGFIKKSGQSGAFGPGTYMTDLKPTDFFREDILKNNYGGIANAFKGRADFVVTVNKNNLDLKILRGVGPAVTGEDRSIFVYGDIIRVQPGDVRDKPRCYRAP